MIKILVPVDFSDTSINALQFAIDLFKGRSLKITVLHTYGTPSSAFHMKSLDRVLEEDAERELNQLIRRFEQSEPDVLLKPLNLKGDAVHTVNSIADKGEHDLVVMGTKGASGLKEVFMGSVAGGVVKGTVAPVLVVPAGVKFNGLAKMVLAIGEAPSDTERLIATLRQIKETRGSEIDLFHIGEESDMEELIAPFKELDPVVTLAQGTGDVNKQLNTHLAKVNGDMLCLIRSKRGFFEGFFHESVTLQQTFHSPVPVLVLHN